MPLGLTFGFGHGGGLFQGLHHHKYLFLRMKLFGLLDYLCICLFANPESHKNTRENKQDAISNKLFHKVLLRICVSVRDLTKSQPE